VFQLQPGYAFHLDPADLPFLAPGPADREILDAFARRGRRLSPDARVRRTDAGAWEIDDRLHGWTYRVTPMPQGLEVTILENLREPLPEASHAAPPPELLRDALLAVGSQFARRLIEFRPHVVGFRLEGGGFEPVRQYVAAVRLFCDAEVVLGGPTATSHPREVLEDTGADYVFAGEAEETFAQFLRLAREPHSKDRQPEIPGLAYRYGDRVYHNTLPRDGYGRSVLDGGDSLCGQRAACLRNLLRPVADGKVLAANRLDWSLLQGFLGSFDSLYFTGGRGCPGACTFCAKLHGQEVRIKSAGQLLEEIEAADAQVAAGALRVTRWPLFEHVDDSSLRERQAAWAAIYDEDFFLHRKRAMEFFRLWDRSPLKHRYRLSLQTNPCSLLASGGRVHEGLLEWIDRLKPMVQLGAESFHAEVLRRWHKRHTLAELETVLDALDRTRQDYTVFQLLTDFDTTPEELVETLRLLIASAYCHPRMRIASSPFTIPLYDSDTRAMLEYRGALAGDRVRHFTDYERPQPGWMDPLVADLADLADAELQWALHLTERNNALASAFEVVLARIRDELDRPAADVRRQRVLALYEQALWSMGEARGKGGEEWRMSKVK